MVKIQSIFVMVFFTIPIIRVANKEFRFGYGLVCFGNKEFGHNKFLARVDILW